MRGAGQVLFAVVIAAAVIGFFVGIDDGVPRADASSPSRLSEEVHDAPSGIGHDAPEVVMPATSYLELHRARIGANAGYLNRVEDLAEPDEPPEEAPPAPAKRAALDDRGARRAFNGAPPVIPHSVDTISSDSCLGCHAAAVVLDDNRADSMPHPYLSSCQQCHVPTESPIEPTLLVASRFVGAPAPFEGARAWEGAPPTIPHSTLMRDDCASCHGVNGKPGLRTSHPERLNCTQCHAPSASLDQLAVGTASFLPAPEVGGGR